MPEITNARHVVNEYTSGYPIPGQTTVYDTTQTIDLDTVPLNGGILAKVLLLSVDPYLKRFFNPGSPVPLGSPITSYGILKLIRSEHEKFTTLGAILIGHGNTRHEEYTIITKEEVASGSVTALTPYENLPLSVYIGAAGMPGLTAFTGWKKYADPKEGETVFVTTAAGAVGSLVVQIAKHAGLKVIGSAGSEEKVKFLKELGVHVAFNYKTTDTREVLKNEGPIDIFWDHVGGDSIDAALENSNIGARYIICGAISGYSGQPAPVHNLARIMYSQINIYGHFVIPLIPQYQAAFDEEIVPRLADGTFKYREDRLDGLEKAPQALLDVLNGGNVGKSVVVVGEE